MRLLTCLLLLTAMTGAPPAHETISELEVPGPLQRLLETQKWDQTPSGFRIITLSQLADGCAGQAQLHPARRAEARRCAAGALKLAWRTKPGAAVATVGDAIWLTHLNLIYGAADRLGDCPDPGLHRAITQRLVSMSLADRHAHAPSYSAVKARWPADQAATLASLVRFDSAHGTSLAHAPIAAWKKVVAKTEGASTGHKTGLPRSEVVGVTAGSALPRGCANAFLARYGAEVDRELSAAWWASFRDDWVVHLGPLIGFREWPPGVERPGDSDSGPIILGIGTAASALSIAAARANGDEAIAQHLELSAAQVKMLGVAGGVPNLLLADAISFEGHWQQPATPRRLLGPAGEPADQR